MLYWKKGGIGMEVIKGNPLRLDRQEQAEQYGLTAEEMEKLLGNDELIAMSRLSMLEVEISPDDRCRTLTNGLPVPESWLAAHSRLTEEEIRAYRQGGEMEEEAKCRLFAAEMKVVRYFNFTVFLELQKKFGLEKWEISRFLQEHPEMSEKIPLPEENFSPETMLAEDTRYFCEKTGLPETVLEKLAKGKNPYRLLVTTAVWANLFRSC